jgi:thioredoxin reductase
MRKGRHDAPDISFTFDGSPVRAKDGDSLASALVSQGIYGLKESLDGGRRGVFCGMGVCNECAVVVNGELGKLACMTPAIDGAIVQHQPAYPEIVFSRRELSQSQLPESEISPDVLIIGAGPSGLAAAAVVAEAGLDVVLIDERGKLGGQYFKQPADTFLDEEVLDKQFREGRALIMRVRASKVHILSGASVWGAFSAHEVLASSENQRWIIRPRKLVIATGAYERGIAVPGWTLPGVMTTGAAQTLLRSYQVPLGSQVFISGNGPLNLQMAAELVRAGGTVVGLADSANPLRLANVLSGFALLWYSPPLVLKGIGYFFTLMRAKVPIYFGSVPTRFNGNSAVEEIELSKLSPEGTIREGHKRKFKVDAVALGFGFMPSNEIARALGCEHQYDPDDKNLQVVRDKYGNTNLPDIQVIGDGGGVSGAQIAKAIGILAGFSLVEKFNRGITSELKRERMEAERTHRKNQGFQKHLWKIFKSSVLFGQLAEPSTTICRCLSLKREEIESLLTEDMLSAGALKRVARAGMGICQGRYCGPVIIELSSKNKNIPITEFSGFAPQAPFKPTAINVIAEVERQQ